MTFPTFTDLAALADDLTLRGASPKLRSAITMAWRAQSCLGDLRQCQDCVTLLRQSIDESRDTDTADVLVIERSLMSTAVMLYARATSTSGQHGERGSIQLEQSKMQPDEWADHCKILAVRNQAMAHVYADRDAGDHVWHRDVIFAVERPHGGWSVASASNQTSYHAPTLRRLERMVPVATLAIKAKFDKRISTVTSMLSGKVKVALLRKHAFSPETVFGSAEAVEAILGGSGKGDAAFWVNNGKPVDANDP